VICAAQTNKAESLPIYFRALADREGSFGAAGEDGPRGSHSGACHPCARLDVGAIRARGRSGASAMAAGTPSLRPNALSGIHNPPSDVAMIGRTSNTAFKPKHPLVL
jgi:hypothetical protein